MLEVLRKKLNSDPNVIAAFLAGYVIGQWGSEVLASIASLFLA